MGTAPLARASLEALLVAPGFSVSAVVTQPDRPKGRDLKLQASAVKEAALQFGLPVLQPAKARDPEFIQQLRDLEPELIVVAAYGQILPAAILDLPRLGCLNVHTSLLPKYRGAAPIQWAILDDEKETGVTIMKMDPGLDTGPILTQSTTPISPDDDAATLHDRLARLGGELLTTTIPPYANGEIAPRPQVNSEATHASKITKEDGRLDWTLPARRLWNKVRALTPWPGTFTTWNGQTLKIWRAQETPRSGAPGEILASGPEGLVVGCGEGSLCIQELQLPGARRMTTVEFLSGHRLAAGEKLW